MTWKLHIVIMLVGILTHKSKTEKKKISTHAYDTLSDIAVRQRMRIASSKLFELHNLRYIVSTDKELSTIYTHTRDKNTQAAKQPTKDMPIKTFSPNLCDLSSSTQRNVLTCIC